MTAIKYIKEQCSHIELKLFVPDFFLEVAKNLVPNMSINPFSKKYKFNKDLGTLKTDCLQHDTLGTHLVDNAFHVLVNKQVSIEHKNYVKLNTKKIKIDKFNLPSKYVVVCTGFTAPVREWIPSSINGTVDYIKSKGYKVVFLGNKVTPVIGCADDIIGKFNLEVDYSKGMSLIDKTTLLEAGAIIGASCGIIGNDNGLLHLAGCTEVPIVGGFTSVNPSVRMPYRHNILGWNFYPVVPEESLECRFCQSDIPLYYNFNFTQCLYGDRLCTKQLTADKFIEQLEKFL